MSEPCCPPGQTSCVATTVVRNVCLLLKPNGNAKIRAVRTLTIATDCTQTVAYVADIGLYNPLTGYTQADEIPCGTGEYIPFASPSIGGDATAANQTLELAQLTAINAGIPAALGQTTMLNSMPVAIASDQSPIPTNPLKRPATARQLPAIATSSSVQTTAGVLAVSMIARGADIRYRVTLTTSTAVAIDHLIIQNERLDIAVLSGGFISAIRDAATSGVLEISELV